MATSMLLLLRNLARRHDLLHSPTLSASASATAYSRYLSGNVKRPLLSIIPLGKQTASFARSFSSKPDGDHMEEKNVEDFEGGAAVTTHNQEGGLFVGTTPDKTQTTVTSPLNTVAANMQFDDPQTQKEVEGLTKHTIVEDPHRYVWFNGKLVSANKTLTNFFKVMKESGESALGRALSKSVIIIPACWNHIQQLIKDSATTAGLDAQCIIVNEPTADAFPSGLRLEHEDCLVIFDLTSEPFILKVQHFHNLSLENGVNYDNMLELIVKELKRAHGIDFTDDPAAVQKIQEAIGRASVSKSDIKIKLPVADGSRVIEKIMRVKWPR